MIAEHLDAPTVSTVAPACGSRMHFRSQRRTNMVKRIAGKRANAQRVACRSKRWPLPKTKDAEIRAALARR